MKKETSFDDLIQAIQDAFIKVNNMSEAQHLQKISDYFDENNKAKVFEIQYPKFDEMGRVQYTPLSVPQICLLPMSSLKLDEVEVDFKVRLYGGVKIKPAEADNVNRFQSNSNDTFLGYFPQGRGSKNTDENYANIKLKFVSDQPPEGLMRIQDQYTKIIL